MRSIYVIFLKEDVKNELNFIVSNHTLDLYDLPKDFKFICSKWTFRKKLSPEATIDKYKAIILMRIFNQKKGVDYFDIYSLLTKIMTVSK